MIFTIANRLHNEVRCSKVRNRYVAEHQRQHQYHPTTLPVIQQEGEERKQHVEGEDRTQEPPNAYHFDIRVR